MRRAMFLVVAVAILGSIVGCGSDGDDGDTAVSSPPDTGPVDTGGGGARVVTPTPGLDDVRVTAVDSVSVLDGSKLEVRFYNGVEACYGVERVDVDETDADVTVSVLTGSRPDARGQACIEIAELVAVVVTLDRPLGDRAVIDRSSGAAVAVT